MNIFLNILQISLIELSHFCLVHELPSICGNNSPFGMCQKLTQFVSANSHPYTHLPVLFGTCTTISLRIFLEKNIFCPVYTIENQQHKQHVLRQLPFLCKIYFYRFFISSHSAVVLILLSGRLAFHISFHSLFVCIFRCRGNYHLS